MPKKEEVSEQPAAAGAQAHTPEATKKTRRMGWAELLARVFAIDMKHCPNCESENFKPIAAIVETSVIRKILTHLKLPHKPPDIAPARVRQMSFA